MKRLVVVLSLLSISFVVFAHPAMEVTIKPDYVTKAIDLSYIHKVNDNSKHYIDEIKVRLNGKEIITQILSVQESGNGGAVKYLIPELKKGDKIEVETRCSKGGNKTGKIDGW